MDNSQGFKFVTISYDPCEELWKLAEEYEYTDQEKQWKITIKKDSRYDLSSIPRLFWKVVSPFDLSNEAPLIHDYLYVTEGGRRPDPQNQLQGKIEPIGISSEANSGNNPCLYSRKEADFLFRTIMQQAKVKPWRRHVGFWTVYLVNFWRQW